MGKRYRKAMKELQLELIRLQHGLHCSGKRLLVIFEGRDAAGKGGTIKYGNMDAPTTIELQGLSYLQCPGAAAAGDSLSLIVYR